MSYFTTMGKQANVTAELQQTCKNKKQEENAAFSTQILKFAKCFKAKQYDSY